MDKRWADKKACQEPGRGFVLIFGARLTERWAGVHEGRCCPRDFQEGTGGAGQGRGGGAGPGAAQHLGGLGGAGPCRCPPPVSAETGQGGTHRWHPRMTATSACFTNSLVVQTLRVIPEEMTAL